jgi:hypothetical protein
VGFPTGVDVVDTMVVLPPPRDLARPDVSHLFGDGAVLAEGEDPIAHTLEQMDRFHISRALLDVTIDPSAVGALDRHPERFLASCSVDPNDGVDALRLMDRMKRQHDVRAISVGPAFVQPQVPIDDKRLYPVYAKCVELGLPIFITVGVPGPRVPMAAQRVELLDEVCWFFPELQIVMRHGAQPWADLAVALMRKWPNLHYSTSAFAPKRYPQAIIDYANTNGRDRVLFAGYFAVGLTWERIFGELAALPLRDDVWPLFLRANADRLLGLSPSHDHAAPDARSS